MAADKIGTWAVFGISMLLALAAEGASAQSDSVLIRLAEKVYTIEHDGTYVEERRRILEAKERPGLEQVKQSSFSFSTTAQQGEVVEAYTEKPDGRRVDVRRDSLQEQVNRGHQGNRPAYSDRTTISLAYPDVELGDKVVLVTRIRTKTPIFNGHFSTQESFTAETAYDKAVVRFNWPSDLPVKFQVNACEASESVAGMRKELTVTCTNPKAVRSKRRNWSVVDYDAAPGVLFSTHTDYQSIAQAYRNVAAPKLVISPRIEKLAADTVAGAQDATEKVRRLYEFVAMEIGYAGNCVGVGTHVPRDLDWILDNRMGDCKDHALLLQALLKAQGIESDQALVNAGSSFQLTKVPVIGNVNHVINYLPEQKIYVDSTAAHVPYGYLPSQLYGKPVILVNQYREGERISMTRPVPTQRVKGKVNLLPDGSAEGDISVDLTGEFAIGMRGAMRGVTREDSERSLSDTYDPDGSGAGYAKWVKIDDAKALTDSFSYQLKFKLPRVMAPGSGSMPLFTPVATPGAPAMLAAGSIGESGAKETVCSAGNSYEDVEFRFPPSRQLLSVPKNTQYKSALLTYSEKYTRKGHVIQVSRKYLDTTPGPLCDDLIQKQYQGLAKALVEKVDGQLLYK